MGGIGYGVYTYVTETQIKALLPEGAAIPANRGVDGEGIPSLRSRFQHFEHLMLPHPLFRCKGSVLLRGHPAGCNAPRGGLCQLRVAHIGKGRQGSRLRASGIRCSKC